MELEQPTAEIRILRRCLSDLLALMALPATWTTRSVAEIAETTLDVLVAALRLEFACIRLEPSVDGVGFEMARAPLGHALAGDLTAVRRRVGPWLARDARVEDHVVRDLPGSAAITVASFRLGLHDDLGTLVAGATRPDFPTALDRLLLVVACNQAAMGLHDMRDQHEQRRRATAVAERRELEAGFEATLNERTRIAREMHDTLLQGFTGVVLHLTTLARGTAHSPATKDAVERVITLAQRTLTDGRMAVSGLREAEGARGDLVGSVRALGDEILGRWGVGVTLEVMGPARAITRNVEQMVLLVTQEALTNVVKHARASKAQIHIAFEQSDVEVRIIDDGCGFHGDAQSRAGADHWGLVGMRERALASSGSLRIHSEPGVGTEVVLRVPYVARVDQSKG